MKLYSCYQGERYTRLANALRRSSEYHLSGWTIDICNADLTEDVIEANVRKVRCWNIVVQSAADGENIVFCDADFIVLGNLDCVFADEFDVAICDKLWIRMGGFDLNPVWWQLHNPINAGCLYVRVNEQTRSFFTEWVHVIDRFQHNIDTSWESYAGPIDQAALAWMVIRGDHPPCNLVRLPCHLWNNCYGVLWKYWFRARMVHVKGSLRRACLGESRKHAVGDLAEVWRSYERNERPKIERDEYFTAKPVLWSETTRKIRKQRFLPEFMPDC